MSEPSDNEPIVISSEAVLSSGKEIEGYLERLNADDSDIEHPSGYFTQLAINSSTAPLKAEIERLRNACFKQENEIQQIAGKVLGYPWFKDDQKVFPGATEVDGVCVGDHVAESIVAELANKFHSLSQQNEQLEKLVCELRDGVEYAIRIMPCNCEYNLDRQHSRDCNKSLIIKALSSTPADIAKKWVGVEQVKAALPEPAKLRLIAQHFAIHDMLTGLTDSEVQDDLRKWADNIEALTLAQKELEKV